MNRELPDVQAGFWKAEEPEIKLPTSTGSSKKQGSSRKTFTSASLSMLKPFNCVDHNKLWTILQEMEIPDHLPCLLRNLYVGEEASVRTRCRKTDWFQIEKGVLSRLHIVTLHIVTLLIKLTCTVHHAKYQAGWSTSWNQDCWEKYQKLQIFR